jgi:hypothetical protein
MMDREERAKQLVEEWWPRKDAALAIQVLYRRVLRALYEAEIGAYEQGYRDAEVHAQRAWEAARPAQRGELGPLPEQGGEEEA